MDISVIERTYANMSDSELIRIATVEAHGLRPEVFGIIEKEIQKRNLNLDMLNGVAVQNKLHTDEEIENYAKIIQKLPCPVCGQTLNKLNGTTFYIKKSFLIFSISEVDSIIACPDCLDSKNDEAIRTTALLGWWQIPFGLIGTPIYIYRNIKAKKNRTDIPNQVLLAYTQQHIGEIEAFKNDKEKLQEVISPKKKNNLSS